MTRPLTDARRPRTVLFCFWAFVVVLWCAGATRGAELPEYPRTWDECGARPDDPSFDNGPVLSKILAAQCAREVKTCPVGTLADYYIRTPIVWPAKVGGVLEGAGGYTYAYSTPTIGATRIVWAGEPGGTMIDYHGSGGRIANLILQGGPLTNDYQTVAGDGVRVHAHTEPPSGNLVTQQLAIVQCTRGLHYLATPDNNHADLGKHLFLLAHRVAYPYVVDGEQSCPHWLFGFDCREGFRQAFTFERGGALHVCGMYAGGSRDATLLYVGRSNDHVGRYQIDGLQIDGAVKNLTLVSHGQFLFDCRISGQIGFAAQLAAQPIVAREGPSRWANVRVDLGSDYQFPAPPKESAK